MVWVVFLFICTQLPVFAAVIDLSQWTESDPQSVFTSPEFMRDGSLLVLTARNNTNTFGYWESPPNSLNTVPSYLYHMEWTVASDVTPVERCPSFRLRINSHHLQQGDILGMDSLGGAENFPSSMSRCYHHYFLPATSTSLAQLAFDLLNFSHDNVDVGSLALSRLEVKGILLSNLTRSLLKSWDFTSDAEGWDYVTIPATFSEPAGIWDDGALKITATNNRNNFGFWSSPGNIIEVTPDTLYEVEYTLKSDVTEPEQVPDLRLRVNTSDWQTYATKVISSVHNADESPSTTPRAYSLYLYQLGGGLPTTHSLICSFDLMNFDPGNSSDGSLSLDSISVYSVDLE